MTHALVVGGTRGLGRELVRGFHATPHVDISVIARNIPTAPEMVSSERVRYYAADLHDLTRIDAALDAINQARGALNYLIFCQRYRGSGDGWAGEIEVSLTATRHVIDQVAPHFSGDGAKSIVIASSVYGYSVGDSQPLSYHVAKAGLNHMAKFYAVQLGPRGIRVNVVSPFTFVKEETSEYYGSNETLQKMYREIVPLGRMGTTTDTANLIMFLCSPGAAYITGQNISVDGGLSAVCPETIAKRLMAL